MAVEPCKHCLMTEQAAGQDQYLRADAGEQLRHDRTLPYAGFTFDHPDLETALRADFALVQAFLADYEGNLAYALTARNFNPVIALAAATVIVDAEHIVPVGVIAPDHVVTPAPVVDYLIAH